MKKFTLIVAATALSVSAFAQKAIHQRYAQPLSTAQTVPHTGGSNYRTTGLGDTLVLSNIAVADTPLFLYTTDSANAGYLTGTNAWGDQGFAERYDVNGYDSSVQVIGVMARFGGKVNPASTKTVSFMLWKCVAPVNITATLGYNGFPDMAAVDSTSAAVTALGIGAGAAGTLNTYLFDSGNKVQSGPYFVGYTINYNFSTLNGDTLGLACSKDGDRTTQPYTLTYVTDTAGDTTAIDTMVNVQNATMWSDNNWHDNYTDNDSLYNNLAIFPIVVVGEPTGIKGVTRNNLTFYGNYPNPATNSTNIKFSLLTGTGITLQLMDISGRILQTTTQDHLSAGEHIIPVNTADMPAGSYLYLLRTTGGDGMASKLTIVR